LPCQSKHPLPGISQDEIFPGLDKGSGLQYSDTFLYLEASLNETQSELEFLMIFTQTGRLTDFFYVLGMRHFPTHLLLGARPVLFEAGVSCLGTLYIKEIRNILLQTEPEILFLTHVHFDHCGTAGFLQQSFPKLKIAASRRASEIVGRPNAIDAIGQLNQMTFGWVETEAPGLAEDISFKPFRVDLILSDGDCIEIERGLTVQVIETPGHTWDALSYYVPEKKLLVAGEAVGCMDPTGFIYTEFLVDFEAYLHSMERLATLEVDILCQSHHQVFTGTDARSFFGRSIQAAKEYKRWVGQLLNEENGDEKKVAARIKAAEYDPKPGPKQPEQAYLINLAARVKHLAGKLVCNISN
jgi:glyoxylase-like metal-dependent hydrolase (beta-lactamase superfamily II)